MSGYEPQVCVCGHPLGDHKSSRSSWPQPLRFGICLAHGCECSAFVERGPSDLPPAGALEVERFMVRSQPAEPDDLVA